MDADGDDDAVIKVTGVPIYNTHSWSTTNNYGPQCSQQGGFCYMCYELSTLRSSGSAEDTVTSVSIYNDIPAATESVDIKKLEMIIDTLVAERRERSVIVMHIYNLFNRKIRPKTKYRDFHTGMIVHQPEWTRESIDRHITYSNKWPSLFDSTVDGTIQAIMDNQAKFICDGTTGMVIPERVKEWIASGEFLVKWKMCKHKCSTLTSTARKHASVAKTCQRTEE